MPEPVSQNPAVLSEHEKLLSRLSCLTYFNSFADMFKISVEIPEMDWFVCLDPPFNLWIFGFKYLVSRPLKKLPGHRAHHSWDIQVVVDVDSSLESLSNHDDDNDNVKNIGFIGKPKFQQVHHAF